MREKVTGMPHGARPMLDSRTADGDAPRARPWAAFPQSRSVKGWPMAEQQRIWLVRHGETEWSKSGQHTGRTDIPLTATGEEQGRALGRHLAGRQFALVLT